MAQMEQKSPTEQDKAPAIAPQPVASRRRRRHAASDKENVDPALMELDLESCNDILQRRKRPTQIGEISCL